MRSEQNDSMRVVGIQEFVVRDKDGNIKPIWQDFTVGKYLLKFFRKKCAGSNESGILSHLALYGLRIPFITGYWAQFRVEKNLVPSVGKAGIASRIGGSGSEAAATYIAVGTGATAPAAGDTALQTEITDSGLARAAATMSRVTTTVANDTSQADKTFSVTGTKAVTEAGLLNAAAAGVLFGRQTFSAINVVNGDSLQITYKMVVS